MLFNLPKNKKEQKDDVYYSFLLLRTVVVLVRICVYPAYIPDCLLCFTAVEYSIQEHYSHTYKVNIVAAAYCCFLSAVSRHQER